ncbi:MAG: YqaA family protein [Pseudobdellovibrionaceae bacterium]
MSQLGMYFSLFFVSFVAATLFPAQSEVLLAKMVIDHQYEWRVLVLIASVGNVLGSVVNWALGRYFVQFSDRKWFPVKPHQMRRYETLYRKYGRWSLLLSWMPFVGDPLTVMAGILKEPLHVFVVLVSVAKISRYLVVVFVANQWI